MFAWRYAVERSYYHRSYYLLAENDEDAIEGVLPLILVKPPLLQGYLVSLPFCDYGGPLALSRDAAGLLVQRAVELAQTFKSRLEIRCMNPEPCLQPFARLAPLSHKVRMLLDLPAGSEALWSSFKSKLRSQVRRPQKDGMTFRLCSSEMLDDFYSIFSRNMKELGSPVHAKSWLSSVIDCYKDMAHVGMVFKGTTAVAGGIILDHKDTVSIPWASALSEYNRSSPNMLLYWGLLQYASDSGFKRFDFGRSTPGEGTFMFKEQWGAVPHPLFWYTDDKKDSQHNIAGSGFLRWLIESGWSRLPSRVANSLGPIIRKYIIL